MSSGERSSRQLQVLPDDAAGAALEDDQELLDAGWQRRSMIEPARVEEFTELYEAMGFDVLVRPLDPATFAEKCRQCATSACSSNYVLIYTRRS